MHYLRRAIAHEAGVEFGRCTTHSFRAGDRISRMS